MIMKKFLSEKGGITLDRLQQLGDRKVILENLCWKPDQLYRNNKREFFPYLDINFVKFRMIEVCGAGNIQFQIEKDSDKPYAIGNMAVFVEGDWIWNSAIGTERDSKLKDETKRNKAIYKGNHSDAYKSCAELFGLVPPPDVKRQLLDEKDKVAYSREGKAIGHIEFDKQKVNAYLNNMNASLVLMAQVYKANERRFKENQTMNKMFIDIAEFIKKGGE